MKPQILFLLFLLVPFVSADDEMMVACGGDDQMIIMCPVSDDQLSFFGKEPTVSNEGGIGWKGKQDISPTLASPKEYIYLFLQKNFYWCIIITMIIAILFILLILFFKKNKSFK